MTVTGMSIDRLVVSKFVESFVCTDALGLLQQLGVMPPPPGQAKG